MPEDRLLSPEEVAERLGVSRLTAVRWMRSGKLPNAQKLGKKTVRMKASDLEAFIDQHRPALTLVDASAPTLEGAHIADQLDANTVALAMKLRQPGEDLSGVVRRALLGQVLFQGLTHHVPNHVRALFTSVQNEAGRSPAAAQETQGPTPKELMFSNQQKDILTLLRQHPEGLKPVQVRQLLGSDEDLGNTMKAMARDGLLRRIRPGMYAVASE
jgi:excisionase family DNA binding protein